MRRRFVRLSRLVLLVAVLASACSILPSAPSSSEGAVPTAVQLSLEDAEAIAGTFLEAWVNSDYPAMYQLIGFRSREAYPQDVFVGAYDSVADEMTLESLS